MSRESALNLVRKLNIRKVFGLQTLGTYPNFHSLWRKVFRPNFISNLAKNLLSSVSLYYNTRNVKVNSKQIEYHAIQTGAIGNIYSLNNKF